MLPPTLPCRSKTRACPTPSCAAAWPTPRCCGCRKSGGALGAAAAARLDFLRLPGWTGQGWVKQLDCAAVCGGLLAAEDSPMSAPHPPAAAVAPAATLPHRQRHRTAGLEGSWVAICVVGEKSKPRETAAGALRRQLWWWWWCALWGCACCARCSLSVEACMQPGGHVELPFTSPAAPTTSLHPAACRWRGVFMRLAFYRPAGTAGRSYSIWKVTDLDQTCLSLFLFSGAHDELWREAEGSIVALLSPKVRHACLHVCVCVCGGCIRTKLPAAPAAAGAALAPQNNQDGWLGVLLLSTAGAVGDVLRRSRRRATSRFPLIRQTRQGPFLPRRLTSPPPASCCASCCRLPPSAGRCLLCGPPHAAFAPGPASGLALCLQVWVLGQSTEFGYCKSKKKVLHAVPLVYTAFVPLRSCRSGIAVCRQRCCSAAARHAGWRFAAAWLLSPLPSPPQLSSSGCRTASRAACPSTRRAAPSAPTTSRCGC